MTFSKAYSLAEISGYGRVVRLDDDGHAAAMSGVMVDIKQRRQAAAALT